MSSKQEVKTLTCDQIIHIINETHERIWEDDTIERKIDFRTIRYIMNTLKNVFIEYFDDETVE